MTSKIEALIDAKPELYRKKIRGISGFAATAKEVLINRRCIC